MDAGQTHRLKAGWELHKNVTSYIEQLLEATPHETTAVWPITPHLKIHPSKIKKTCGTGLEKQERIHK